MSEFVFGAINDNDESLKGKEGSVKFGLNQGAYISKLEYNPNAGKDGAAADAVDLEVNVGGKVFMRRFYDVTRIYDKDGNQILDTESEEYKKKYKENMSQIMGSITHIVKSTGVTQDQINRAFATPVNNFVDWSKVMLSLVPTDYSNHPKDIFLEYQWKIPDSKDRTYLELPKNMKGSYWIVPTIKPVGKWVEERAWTEVDDKGQEINKEGLRYVDEAKNVHPFVKSQSFMNSNKAIQQFVDGQQPANAVTASNQQPKKATW